MPAATEAAEAAARAATQLGDLPYLSSEQADAALTLAGVRTARDAAAAGRTLVVRRPADLVPALAGVGRPHFIVIGAVATGVVLWKAVPAFQRRRQRAAGPGEDHADRDTPPEA
ncbi:hypothetical protein [Candidatus Solirubrobacter pratensis]|uniref:hypothetical protein n=1 Tax=Candidatus Solirubrobacter pratensis TaxID=1298857 RepID=UPI0004156E94|nr:hypothetical protein [Candidatus Solirubrobacter pratensis]